MSPDIFTREELLARQIEEASKVIAPLWPLSAAVTVNPFWDLLPMGFGEAVFYAQSILEISGYPSREMLQEAYADGRITDADLEAAYGERAVAPVPPGHGHAGDTPVRTTVERHDLLYGTGMAAATDREVAKWCAAYTANLLPLPPGRDFYSFWRQVIVSDPASRRLLGKSGRKRLGALPRRAIDAVAQSLEKLGVSEEGVIPELSRQLARMPGWAGYAKWGSVWGGENPSAPAPLLTDYLAVRLAYDAELLGVFFSGSSPGQLPHQLSGKTAAAKEAKHADTSRTDSLPSGLQKKISLLSKAEADEVWLRSYENHYRDSLLSLLSAGGAKSDTPPAVQAVFCIDVRSERIRRHLEEAGPYETFGFAGFFGLPISFRALGSEETISLCPVFAKPAALVTEKPARDAYQSAIRQLAGSRALEAAANSFNVIRKGGVSSFFTAEIGGFFLGPAAAVKTVFPARYATLRQRLHQRLAPKAETVIDMSPDETGMSDEEQALFAESLLLSIGITSNFAKIVLLCGHGSTTENNPYASMLDCGACGANRGGVSARAAAAVLNRARIRSLLEEKGIPIPGNTFFMAAEHDTATDQVGVLDTHLVPAEHRDAATALQRDLEAAGRKSAAERAADLPGHSKKDPGSETVFRSSDWAQVRPEWGAAGNAAFIIAPRKATVGLDLGGRCFLHSYDADADAAGTVLEAILSGPVTVGHWINAQYYFSAVDPEKLSAGDKTVHNIISGIGVTEGTGLDLKIGLPRQSLFYAGKARHEPMRLLTVVQAKKNLLEEIISRNATLGELFDGEWIHLAARDGENDAWHIRRPGGKWDLWELPRRADHG